MKIYIAGKVRGLENYKEIFKEAEIKLKEKGHVILNPAELPEGLDAEDYMRICIPMLDVADAIYLLKNWQDSEGAKIEKLYAQCQNKLIFFDY